MKYLNKLKKFAISAFTFFNFMCLKVYADGVPAMTEKNFFDKMKPFIKEYKLALNAFIGFTVITSILVVIVNLMRLAFHGGDHPMIRQQIERNLLTSFICLMLLGGAGTIYAAIIMIVFN